MKNSKKRFICLEAVLAVMVAVLAFLMYREQKGEPLRKVSVILPDSDSGQWSAFRYGLRMAAEDQGVEMFVVSIGDKMTVHEEIKTINYEIDNGADAVIVLPVPGTDAEAKLKKAAKKIPVMLVESTASKRREDSELPTTQPDNYAMGKTLAEEILADYNGKLKGKTLGIVMVGGGSEAIISRLNGFQETLKGTGVKISWSVSGSFREGEEDSLVTKPRVDLVAALDNDSLITAGEYAAANNLHGALLYGIGNSTEVVYYLDTGAVECLVVPDDFSVGYQSLTEVAENLSHIFHKMENHTLSYTVLRKEELFAKENQEILFTMSQ